MRLAGVGGALVIGAALLACCSRVERGGRETVSPPAWARATDQDVIGPISTLMFEYAGEGMQAVSWSKDVLERMGFLGCAEGNVYWHDYRGARSGMEVGGRRFVQFWFRDDSPAIATVEVIAGDGNNVVSVQMRQLQTAEQVQGERDLLCREAP